MALSFTVTREDMLRGKTIEAGWYKAKVKKVTQEPSNAGDSTNTWVDFVITQDGGFKDVPCRRCFSEKAPGFIVPYLVAAGANVNDNGGTFDVEKSVGREMLIYIKNDMYEGRLTNKVEDFRPLQAAAEGAKQ